MRKDDTSTALDRDEFDGEEAEIFVGETATAEPVERVDDPDAEPDDELLEAELGEHDIALEDVLDLEDDVDLDPGDLDHDDDEMEMALLHEFGIDLDAPDEPSELMEALAVEEDPSADDEVAA